MRRAEELDSIGMRRITPLTPNQGSSGDNGPAALRFATSEARSVVAPSGRTDEVDRPAWSRMWVYPLRLRQIDREARKFRKQGCPGFRIVLRNARISRTLWLWRPPRRGAGSLRPTGRA